MTSSLTNKLNDVSIDPLLAEPDIIKYPTLRDVIKGHISPVTYIRNIPERIIEGIYESIFP